MTKRGDRRFERDTLRWAAKHGHMPGTYRPPPEPTRAERARDRENAVRPAAQREAARQRGRAERAATRKSKVRAVKAQVKSKKKKGKKAKNQADNGW
jgi:hypothetical protein